MCHAKQNTIEPVYTAVSGTGIHASSTMAYTSSSKREPAVWSAGAAAEGPDNAFLYNRGRRTMDRQWESWEDVSCGPFLVSFSSYSMLSFLPIGFFPKCCAVSSAVQRWRGLRGERLFYAEPRRAPKASWSCRRAERFGYKGARDAAEFAPTVSTAARKEKRLGRIRKSGPSPRSVETSAAEKWEMTHIDLPKWGGRGHDLRRVLKESILILFFLSASFSGTS